LAAFGAWGVMPLYFAAMRSIPPLEILGQRIVWSLALLTILLFVLGRWGALSKVLTSRRAFLMFLASSIFLSGNWLIYIYGVANHQTVETSLGYFINPLLNVALGVVIFHERLRPAQLVALILGALAVGTLVVGTGTLPLIALSLAVTFATYGLIRKVAPADAIVGLSIETMLLAPAAAGYLAYLTWTKQMRLVEVDGLTAGLLIASGVITTLPLLCFGHAARTVPLSTLGFMQFISPSMQFILAVTALGEPLSMIKLAAFICIWIGLAIYSIDAWRVGRARTDEFVNEQVVESAAAEA
jgi:chloramphenicol-sensitive protein RarD